MSILSNQIEMIFSSLLSLWRTSFALSPRPFATFSFAFDIPPPDFVLVNLGANDFGFPQSEGRTFPKNYVVDYKKLLASMRQQYAHAQFILLIGGMNQYAESPDLREGFSEVASWAGKEIGARNYVFKASSETHPRIEIHKKMAEELSQFLSSIH